METMEKVNPAAPVAPWLGGKKALHRRIIERIDHLPHETYVEPFVGMGGVFLRRGWRPKCEVANDLNGEVVNLFRILQRHLPQLLSVMRYQVASRREFDRLRACDPDTLTDLERAARFLYLQRLAFGGKFDGVFGVKTGCASRFNLSRLEPLLDAAHERLESVVFENLPWQDVLERYDSSGSLFYLDPPYWGNEKDYGADMFARDDFEQMASMLRDLKGNFILSINDCEGVRDTFAGFEMEEVSLKYTIAQGSTSDAKELLISNRGDASRLI